MVSELVEDIRTESLASAIIGAAARHETLPRGLLPSDDGTLTKQLAQGIERAFVEAALRFGAHGGSPEHRLRCAYTASEPPRYNPQMLC